MKKTFIILFTLVYSILSVGFSFSIHHCLGAMDKSCCQAMCCGDSEEESSSECKFPGDQEIPCCNEEVVVIQMDSEQFIYSASDTYQEEFIPIASVPFIIQNQKDFYPSRQYAKNFVDDRSPPLWLLFHNFTFYG